MLPEKQRIMLLPSRVSTRAEPGPRPDVQKFDPVPPPDCIWNSCQFLTSPAKIDCLSGVAIGEFDIVRGIRPHEGSRQSLGRQIHCVPPCRFLVVMSK